VVQSITDVLGDQKRTVEQTRKIDIRALQRAGYFSAPKEGWQVWRIDGQITGIARINWDGDQLTITQVIEVARTPCPFGGHRLWFWCSCDRHVLTFYSPNATILPMPRGKRSLGTVKCCAPGESVSGWVVA